VDAPLVFRPIHASDNQALARIIRDVFEEFDVPKTGTAFADPSIDDMHAFFGGEGAAYWVVYRKSELLGGAGIAPLKGGATGICELQKMYVDIQARSQGIGHQLLSICLEEAKTMGYSKCYLETMTNMQKAQELYKKFGFVYLENRLGETGHFACPVWMIKEL